MSDLKLIETDSVTLYNKIILALEKGVGEPLYPGDERRIFGEALVSLIVSIFNMVNDACKQKMLDYARDEVLDALGARTATKRIEPAFASTTMRFSMKSAVTSNVIIPKGTRITPDNAVYFSTNEAVVIEAGSTYSDVEATCETSGESYNGYNVGTICQLVDLIPYVDNVENVTVTDGGDDGEPYTDAGNDKYRERIRLSVSKMTTAGPKESYRYYALSADASIVDVSITSPNPGEVLIVPICTGGAIPDEDVLTAVENTCSADKVRPMTDLVTVRVPEQVTYDINIKYYTTEDNESECVATIEGDGGAVDLYKSWQNTALGRDINPDKLRALILSPASGIGATRVDVVSPSYTVVGETQVAKVGSITITHEIGGD